MGGKGLGVKQIIAKLRRAGVHSTKGDSIAEVCHKLRVCEQTYCRWGREYGGLA